MAVTDRTTAAQLTHLHEQLASLSQEVKFIGIQVSIPKDFPPHVKDQIKAELRVEVEDAFKRTSVELSRNFMVFTDAAKKMIKEECRNEYAVLQEQIEEVWAELRERAGAE